MARSLKQDLRQAFGRPLPHEPARSSIRGYPSRVDAIVYSMGKVGSSTVSQSLRTAGLQCLDVHVLGESRIVAALSKAFKDPDTDIIPEHLADSIFAHNAIRRQERVRMISLIRNPIARNISAVFQNLPERLADDRGEIMKRLRSYSVRTPDHWFKNEFIPVTGVDVFHKKIDSAADHFRFSNGKFDILLIKLETSDARISRLISDFVEADIELTRANEASGKWYGPIYREIIANPECIRGGYVEECANLKYFRTFYLEGERSGFVRSAAQAAAGAARKPD